jgi:hypothetical protein
MGAVFDTTETGKGPRCDPQQHGGTVTTDSDVTLADPPSFYRPLPQALQFHT